MQDKIAPDDQPVTSKKLSNEVVSAAGEGGRADCRVFAILREFYDPGLGLHINGIYIRVRVSPDGKGFFEEKNEEGSTTRRCWEIGT